MYPCRTCSSFDTDEKTDPDADSSSHNGYSQGKESGKDYKGRVTARKDRSSVHAISVVEEKFYRFLHKQWDNSNKV